MATNRITEKDLKTLANRLNQLTGSPTEYMTGGKINVGHYHISFAYGGVCLQRTCNTGGGVTTPLVSYHEPKRDLYNRMHAFLAGFEEGVAADR